MKLKLKTAQRAGTIIVAVLTLGVFFAGATPANAEGTLAETLVSNTVTVNYEVGGVAQEEIADTETFLVDQMIDVQVTAADASVVPGEIEDTAVLTYVIENQGNDSQGYDLDVVYSDGGVTLTPSTDATVDEGEYALFLDANDNGVYDPGVDIFYDPTGTTNAFDLFPDGTETVFIIAEIPGDATDTETATFDILATTLDAGTSTITSETTTPGIDSTDTVFVDDAGTVAGDDAEDGTHSDDGTFTVQSADLTVSKTAVVIDRDPTVDCGVATQDIAAEQFAIPGACIEYTITVTNTGATAIATDVAISDILPSQITFVAFHTDTSADFTNSEPTDVVPGESGGIVSATEATLDPAQSVDLVIRATIN